MVCKVGSRDVLHVEGVHCEEVVEMHDKLSSELRDGVIFAFAIFQVQPRRLDLR